MKITSGLADLEDTEYRSLLKRIDRMSVDDLIRYMKEEGFIVHNPSTEYSMWEEAYLKGFMHGYLWSEKFPYAP